MFTNLPKKEDVHTLHLSIYIVILRCRKIKRHADTPFVYRQCNTLTILKINNMDDLYLGELGTPEMANTPVDSMEMSAWCTACALCAACGGTIVAWSSVAAFSAY